MRRLPHSPVATYEEIPKPVMAAVDALLATCGTSLASLIKAEANVPRRISQKEACQYLGGISTVTFWRLQNEGEIQPIHIGRRVVYDTADLDHFLRNRKRPRKYTWKNKEVSQ